jgi:hypothetical protein
MAERKVADMHPDFARWYGEVSLVEGSTEARWIGVNQIAASPSRTTIEVLVRLAFDTKASAAGHKEPKLAEKLKEFNSAFKKADDNYDPGAGRENQVLAACTLIQLFKSYSLAQLAVTTTAFGGARKPQLPMDLVGLAEQAIKDLGAAHRARPDLAALKVAIPEIAYKPDFTAAQSNNPPSFEPLFTTLKDAADLALRTRVVRFNSSIDKMGSYMRVADEELQMLWWLLGERSIDLNLPFDKVDHAIQPLVFARELIGRTVASPGPLAIGALMSRAGLKSRGKLSVVAAANAVSDEWAAETISPISASAVTSPIHFALDKRVETGDRDAWVKSWSAVTGLSEDEGASPLLLGELFYRERLFLTYE